MDELIRFNRDEKRMIMSEPSEYPNLMVLLKKQNEFDFGDKFLSNLF